MGSEDHVSIEGILLMLDDVTPHVAVPVQAVQDGEVIATTLSDERGKYKFINLKPGRYRLRCQILGGYVYYRDMDKTSPFTPYGLIPTESADGEGILQVDSQRKLEGVNFHFAPFKKGTWKNYNTFDGLVNNSISTICCNKDGMLWFGTEGGASRYDGKTFVNLTAREGFSHVYAIHCSDEAIWFGINGGGVLRYDIDREAISTYTTKDGLANNNVWTVIQSLDGAVWAGTWGGGISHMGDLAHFVNFTTKDGLAHDIVTVICQDPDGVMWVGTWGGGISRMEDFAHFVNLTTRDGLAHNVIRAICPDPDGNIWFGTKGGGVSRYDGKEFINFTVENGLASKNVLAIHRDPDGVMWFGTDNGVSRYDGKGFVNFTTADGLAHNWIHAIHRSSDGLLWFGTWGCGVSCYDEKSFADLTTKDGLAGDMIRAINISPDGLIWAGAEDHGISRWNTNQNVITSYTTLDGLTDNTVRDILRDQDGTYWFATEKGVSVYSDSTFINIFPELANKVVNVIYRDASGTLWFGILGGGIFRYEGRKKDPLTRITTQDGLPDKFVSALCRAPDGLMWVGTRTGISLYDGREVKEILAINLVNVILSSPDGVMWIATEDGISRYDIDRKTISTYTTQDGLAYNHVCSIYRSTDGVMWFGTLGGGVSRYDGITWTSLDTRDGLTGNIVYSVQQDSYGVLWFGTDRGITRYQVDTNPPRARIIAVTTDRRYTNLNDLKPVDVGIRITFEYGSIDFKTHPQKRLYRHKLSGYDEGWNRPTLETQVDYTNLPIGEYGFSVQAIDRDGNYSEPVTLKVVVQPHPRDFTLTRLQSEVNNLRREIGRKYHFDNIIGRSASIKWVYELMEKAIDSGLAVLISGETGTGKELVAKAIHYQSPRKDYPLMDLNCGAMPRELVASNLFGHRKGAFTSADRDQAGIFEAAAGGTVLLDEISEMPPEAQIHLLRVLQERKVQRVGESQSRDVDVRIIAMTNRDLTAEVKAGRFREDLYYRLSVFPIHIPALRERLDDIPLLAEHFLQKYCRQSKKDIAGFGPGVMEMLQSYRWPGNVRELESAINYAAAFVETGLRIQTYHFPAQIAQGESLMQEVLSERGKYRELLDQFQRRLIENVLKECSGNRHQAAKMLGMDRSNLVKLIKRLGIDR